MANKIRVVEPDVQRRHHYCFKIAKPLGLHVPIFYGMIRFLLALFWHV